MSDNIRPFVNNPSALLAWLQAQGIDVSGVASDSREVRPGDLFLAYKGKVADGRHFIEQAISRGASAIFWEVGDGFSWNPDWLIPNLPVEGMRAYCGPLAHSIYKRPSEYLSLIAITGTNGKTTVSQWIGSTYPRLCGIVGTLGSGLPGRLDDTGLTTPGATTLARCLARFVEEEVHACALEASSIGIEEGRIDGARIDVAVFTNLTRDHLDYHGSMERYAAAKERLFTWPYLRLAVINLDDPMGQKIVGKTTASKLIGFSQNTVACKQHGTMIADEIKETAHGLCFRLCTPRGRARVETTLFGRHNISNLLAVAAVLIDAGMRPSEVAGRLSRLEPPPGRLEKIGGYGEPLVIIDYAHTPDALENALKALQHVASCRDGGLAVVFGCGGGRDRGKRPEMGKIATDLADRVVLTSDNPRDELPEDIIHEISQGAPCAEIIVDRKQAIMQVILEAHSTDVILLAGKGHESYQEMAGVRRPFSDASEARQALAARKEVGT